MSGQLEQYALGQLGINQVAITLRTYQPDQSSDTAG